MVGRERRLKNLMEASPDDRILTRLHHPRANHQDGPVGAQPGGSTGVQLDGRLPVAERGRDVSRRQTYSSLVVPDE